MSSDLKVTNIKHESSSSNNLVLASDGNVSITNTLSAGTIDGNVVFPAGHIVQTVYNPTLSNTSTGTVTGTTDVGRCDITGQITIASGNHVLIYLQCFLRTDGDTNSLGRASISQGTSASLGTQLSQSTGGYDGGEDFYIPISMWAYDSNPQDATTPDYAVAISLGSGATTSVKINEFTSPRFQFYLFEVKA